MSREERLSVVADAIDDFLTDLDATGANVPPALTAALARYRDEAKGSDAPARSARLWMLIATPRDALQDNDIRHAMPALMPEQLGRIIELHDQLMALDFSGTVERLDYLDEIESDPAASEEEISAALSDIIPALDADWGDLPAPGAEVRKQFADLDEIRKQYAEAMALTTDLSRAEGRRRNYASILKLISMTFLRYTLKVVQAGKETAFVGAALATIWTAFPETVRAMANAIRSFYRDIPWPF